MFSLVAAPERLLGSKEPASPFCAEALVWESTGRAIEETLAESLQPCIDAFIRACVSVRCAIIYIGALSRQTKFVDKIFGPRGPPKKVFQVC